MRSPWRALPCLLLLGMPLAAQQAFSLQNGLSVRLHPDHDRPFLELRVELTWPKGEEPPGREGAATFLARMLRATGAGPYDHPGLVRTLEEKGIGVEFQAGPGSFHWTLKCASSLQEEAFSLLAHLVVRPDLTGPLLESQRALCLRERQSQGLAEWANLRFRWELLEARPEALPLERGLLMLSLDTMNALHRRLVRPEKATLHLRGDLNLAQARQLALLNFGAWGPAPEPPLPPTTDSTPRITRPPGCLAVEGPTVATLALLPPGESGAASLELLAELLPRWLDAVPEDLQKATGRVTRLADNRPCVILEASGEKGSAPAQLLLGLRQWAEKLGNRRLTPEDCALASRLRASREAVLAGPVDLASRRKPMTATPGDLSKVLKAWLESAQQRALLSGTQEIPQDHPALKDIGPLEWVRSKE